MTSASRRTWHKHHVGRFHVTVEAEPQMATLAKEASPPKLSDHRGLANVAKKLVEVFDAHRLPATWAVGDPAHSATTAQVTLSAVPHEMALLGDHHWLGPTAGRTRFARELTRRVTQARAQGIEVVTIVPRVAPLAEQIDLVVKQGLHAVVATTDAASLRGRGAGPQSLHYGVWEFATTERLPSESSWLFAGWKLSRHICKAAHDTATFHLMIDAAAIEEQGTWAIRMIGAMARRVAVLRDRGLLQVETLGAAAARLSDLPGVKPQRSILRAA